MSVFVFNSSEEFLLSRSGSARACAGAGGSVPSLDRRCEDAAPALFRGAAALRRAARAAFPGKPPSARARGRAPVFPPPPPASLRGAGAGAGRPRGGYGGSAELPARDFGTAMWCLHCSSERTQSLLELELDSW